MEKLINTDAAIISIDENEIIHIVMKANVIINIDDVTDMNVVIRNLAQNKPALKLLDATNGINMTDSAKLFSREMYSPRNTIARAIITNSSLTQVLLNFITQFHSSEIPQKYFTNNENAYNWLMSFKNEPKI